MLSSQKYKDWLDFLDHGLHREDSSFLKFAVLWLSFNSYLNEIYSPKIKNDQEKVKAFYEDEKNIKFFDDSIDFIKLKNNFNLTKIDGRDFVENLQSNDIEKRKYLNSQEGNDLKNFMGVIYQIRCNFFHGDKIPSDQDDKRLIEWAYDSFYSFWEKYIIHFKL